ncbi:Os10g0130900 [Oryza sativa Japonica Group]|uniref:Os10g0130900 protein n=1 Tax=Oryza sativa subsp. japonica TaxID=39947 RepID=A0A0P0XRE5_ORYSJ|nr:hypothetical protein EE612_049866 [Oryza sativa]BAT09763.1 Os10g0130900 [Oryza sativa Japonica Group]
MPVSTCRFLIFPIPSGSFKEFPNRCSNFFNRHNSVGSSSTNVSLMSNVSKFWSFAICLGMCDMSEPRRLKYLSWNSLSVFSKSYCSKFIEPSNSNTRIASNRASCGKRFMFPPKQVRDRTWLKSLFTNRLDKSLSVSWMDNRRT